MAHHTRQQHQYDLSEDEDDKQTMEEETEKQNNNRPWLFKKGQSGNPAGRPKTKTLKEFARAYLAGLTDEERIEYFEGLDKKVIWEMGEGKPESKTEVIATVEVISITNEEKQALLSLLNDKGGIN